MHILQILSESFSDPSVYGYIGAGSGLGATVGSIATMGVQKLLNRKSDTVNVLKTQMEVLNSQVLSLQQNQTYTDGIVRELQEKACYRNKCSDRLNGEKVIVRKRKPVAK